MKFFYIFIFSLLTLCVVSPVSFSETTISESLPDLGDPSQAKLTPLDEKHMGEDFMKMLRASGRVMNDPMNAEYLDHLGKRLMRTSSQPQRHVSFFWFANPNINAFTGPDGYIAMNTELMLATSNEDELAGVMAHEIGHVLQGHLARNMALQSKVKMGTLVSMLGALAIGIVAPNAAAGAMTAAMAGGEQEMLNYSRSHEAEADRVGMQVLINAQFNPWGMPQFFKRLLQEERLYQRIPALLNDHPLTQQRISDTENRASHYPSTDHESPLMYSLVKERLRVATAKNTHSLLLYYERLRSKSSSPNIPLQYGYALALSENHQFKEAAAIFQNLIQEFPEELLFQLDLSDTYNEARDTSKALAIMKPLYEKNPNRYPVVLYYVDALLSAKEFSTALRVLENDRLNNPSHPIPYGMLIEAQSKSGQEGNAYQTRANFLLTLGAKTEALDQLKMALHLKNIDEDTKERIEAQLALLRKSIDSSD